MLLLARQRLFAKRTREVQGLPTSREEVRNDFAFYKFARLIQMVADLHVGIDAEGVVNGRQKIVRVNRLLLRTGGGCVRFAVLHSPSDAGAGDHAAVAIRP